MCSLIKAFKKWSYCPNFTSIIFIFIAFNIYFKIPSGLYNIGYDMMFIWYGESKVDQ